MLLGPYVEDSVGTQNWYELKKSVHIGMFLFIGKYLLTHTLPKW